MKILGEKIFARNADGELVSRVGTIFLKTLGLVTRAGVHAMQRVMWLDEINAERTRAGLETMTPEEEDAELAQSVDLVFTEDLVLIRPDPMHVDLALKAEEELQKLVSKRKIRYLNTHSAKVRNALRARGENWRMAMAPISQEDMRKQIESSRVAIDGERIYYYNHATGTRYLTAAGCAGFDKLTPEHFRAQVKEAQTLMMRRNRFGMPEVDLFPVTTPIEIKQEFKSIDVDSLSDDELHEAIKRNYLNWRMTMPPELRDESVENFAWRNEMSRTLSSGPNDTTADERDLIQGISPEFYRQIAWLPGAQVDRGQLIFDSIWDEYNRTRDPELEELCDMRARLLIFDFLRYFSDVEYMNVGRIVRSLARDPIEGSRRGSVYMIQVKTGDKPMAATFMLRFMKWGTAEHLDEGKDLLRSMFEANEYYDYVLDRRLMCRQLGMNLPPRIGVGQLAEPYNGSNSQYRGTTVRTCYTVRPYINGIASDKILPARFHNPAFALKFASLMGEAAAIDLIVGRLSSETKENRFDKYYEVVQMGEDGLPAKVVVVNHAGAFVNYEGPLEEAVAPYANVVKRRKEFVSDYPSFAQAYVESFRKCIEKTQADYRARKQGYDELLLHRPFDVGGSGAYRWSKILERLNNCEAGKIASLLAKAIEEE